MRQKIRERVDIPLGEPGSLIESLKDSFFTGYVLIQFKDSSHSLVFDDGDFIKVIKLKEGSVEITEPQNYRIPPESKVEVYETDPIVVTNMLRGAPDPEKDRHFLLAGAGDPLQQSLPAKALNLQRVTDIARENSLNGYILFHRNGHMYGLILFSEGRPVLIFDGRSYGEKALASIRESLGESYVSILLIEPSLVPLITALGKPQVQRTGKIRGVSDLTGLLDSLKAQRLSGLLQLNSDQGEVYLVLIFNGIPVASFRWNPFSFEEVDLSEVRLPLSYSLYTLYVNPSPREVPFRLEDRDRREVKVSQDSLEMLKEAFVSEVGQAGNALWVKVTSEEEVSEREMSIIEAQRLIKKLALEIPRGEGRKRFLQKAKNLLRI